MPIANINEADLWYDVLGQGEPLLLHHGYTASRVNWMPVAERLKDRYQIILMECRGTGESQHTQSGYEIAQYALDVVGLLDHLALERVAFAGHSMGGGIGFQLGVHHSDRAHQTDPESRDSKRRHRSLQPGSARSTARRKSARRSGLLSEPVSSRAHPCRA